jgi:ATP-binding cassette subfamily B protein
LITTGRLIGSLPAAVRDGAGSAAADTTWRWFIATAAMFVAGPVINSLSGVAEKQVEARYLALVFDMTIEVGTHPYGIGHLEDPETAGRLGALVSAVRDWGFVAGIEGTWSVLQERVGGIGAFVLLAAWRWWAPFVAVAGHLALNRTLTTYVHTVFDDLLDVTGNDRRRATYLHSLMTGTPAGKEIRLFGLTGLLIQRYTTTWRNAMNVVWRNRGRQLRPVLAATIFALPVNAAVFAVLGHDAWAGVVSLASLVTLSQAILALEAFGPRGDPQWWLERTVVGVSELVRLRVQHGLPDIPPRGAIVDAAAPVRDPGAAAAIEFTDVTFTYPSRDEPAFAGLTLRIPAGQSVAVVGVNGAGKSTLIKLLCGLYPPDSGRVRIDGVDPAASEAARRRVAVIFQDFVRYHLPLRDNVGFGAAAADDVLEKALTDAGGAELLTRLDNGLDTVLSPEYTGGTDLSGGQWQRVALARALAAVSGGAGILVLDEPTAALDVRAEAALFDRFLHMTRGVTTLLVSHRLSSVRHADRIVVLGRVDGGAPRIIEDGTHEELLAAGGEYAQMFSLQASRFAAVGADS